MPPPFRARFKGCCKQNRVLGYMYNLHTLVVSGLFRVSATPNYSDPFDSLMGKRSVMYVSGTLA